MVRWVGLRLLLVGTMVFLAGCADGDRPTGPVADRMEGPAGPGSETPRLQVAGDSAVWLSWTAPKDSGHALRYAALDDTWSDPVTVATGANWFVNWADLPSVVPLPEGRAAAHYLESKMPDSGVALLAYDVRLTQRSKTDTWHDPITLHNDDTQAEHGFVSMLPWQEDRLLTVWLDGRDMREDGDMTLRSAVVGPEGTVEQRRKIDERTCECCATSAVRVGDGALVAYRDRSDDEVRDIHVTRYDGTEWTEPTLLHDDGWEIEGCPVNGPALAANGERVAAAWFTAAAGTPRVRSAISTDGGQQFSEPVEVAKEGAKGRVDVALLDDGAAAVSWLESTEEGGAVRVRIVSPDAPTSSATTVARLPSASRAVGFPKMVHHDGALYHAWVRPDAEDTPARVQVARTPVERLR
ncbi:MAG: hypothetical protein ACLFTE_01685 [Salinivenus sp.]